VKVTFATDDDSLYRAVKAKAAARGRPVREVVEEALRQWLERQEDEEDVADADQALADYEREGGVAAADYFQHLAAELRARYGPDRD
jgi:predicted DNA binding CopG/RHH family protein